MGIGIFVPNADFSAKNLGIAVASIERPAEAISISVPNSIQLTGQAVATVYPIFSTHKKVFWSIVQGSEYATISQSGLITVEPFSNGNTITIRAAVDDSRNIFSEKQTIVYGSGVRTYDWIQGDADAYIKIPGGEYCGYRIEAKVTYTTPNGYPFGSGHNPNSVNSRIGTYQQNNTNQVAVARGSGNYTATGKVRVENQPYIVEFITSTKNGSNYTNDASVKIYTLGEQIYSSSGFTCYQHGDMGIFGLGSNQSGPGTTFSIGNKSANKLFYYKMWNPEGVLMIDLRPTLQNGVAGLIDLVSNTFYSNENSTGEFTVGND